MKVVRGLAAACLVVGLAAPLGAQGAPAPASMAQAPDAPITDTGYVMGPGDVLEIAVVGRDDYKAKVRVQSDGTIQLPLIGTVKAQGRTPLQLGADVKAALLKGGYYANPVVSVDISTYSSRYVTVLGEVNQPGIVPIDRAYRVSEILARAGSAKESGADHIMLRRANGEEQQLSIVALATGGPSDDPVVNPGDKLYVPAAKTFYIYGQVNAPGVFRLDTAMTLRQAIARGGGLTASGTEKRVRLYREGKEIKPVGLNDPIRPGDVLVVGERLF